MTASYAFSPDNGRQGKIFFLVLTLHAALLYCVAVHKLRHEKQARRESEVRIDLFWPTLPPAHRAAPPIQPQSFPARPATAAKASPLPNAAQKEVKPEPPPAPPQPEPPGKKPLDLEQVLKDVSAVTRQLDSEPGSHALQAEPTQPSFESKLGKIVSNATAKPKFFEAPKIEEITSGAQLDAGMHIYKVITFAGEYCVYYHDNDRPLYGPCPIKF